MKPQLILTPRDWNILKDLYENTVMSFSQIRAEHFASLSVPTVCNRLSKLKQSDLMDSFRVGRQIYQGREKLVGVIYAITKKGIRLLAIKFPEISFREEPMRFNTHSLSHDLILTDVLRVLKNQYPEARVTNGKLIENVQTFGKRLPDAVLEMANPVKKVAIELELTGKSEKRYREIITQYRMIPQFQEVHYITGSRTITERIQCQILGYKIQAHTTQPDTGKFRFTPLHELLSA